MRRFVLLAAAAISVLALAPATALARHHKRHHRRTHHARVRHERFGSDTTTTAPTSDQNAGTVASFSNGVLTITLNGGSTVSGQVTDATRLECNAAQNAEPMEVQNDDHGPGDNGGDNGDRNDNGDQGDDNHQDENAQPACTSASLTPGAVVREAELRISGAGAVWEKVELVTQ